MTACFTHDYASPGEITPMRQPINRDFQLKIDI